MSKRTPSMAVQSHVSHPPSPFTLVNVLDRRCPRCDAQLELAEARDKALSGPFRFVRCSGEACRYGESVKH